MLPDRKILAFDTSAAHCAAALLLGDRVITRVDEMAKGQAEHLMPMLEEMLAAENLTWRDLNGIGVNVGPGNFTGIRISLAAARGLALGLGKPAIGVNGFAARAHQEGYPYTATIPAPRGHSYIQTFHSDADVSQPQPHRAIRHPFCCHDAPRTCGLARQSIQRDQSMVSAGIHRPFGPSRHILAR